MPQKSANLEVSPASGGALMPRASAENVGVRNYTIKRDWRRELDQEVRREGYDFFWPNVQDTFAADPGDQPYPKNCLVPPDVDAGEIELVHMAYRPNGQKAVIVATKSNIYRFFAMENGSVYVATGDDTPVYDLADPDAPVYDDNPGEWLRIGSGFSANGKRWEASNINGYVTLNNGVDPLVTYRIENDEVVPIYELRELGYVAFGTIGDYKDILMLGDLTEIDQDALDILMRPQSWFDSGNILASQALFVTTTNEDFFTTQADWPGVSANTFWNGRTIIYEDGSSANIVNRTGNRSVIVDVSQTVAVPGQRLGVRVRASQTGSAAGSGTASVTLGLNVVTSTVAYFTPAMVGKIVRLANGWSSAIVSTPAGPGPHNTCTVTDNATETVAGLPYRIVSSTTADYTVVSSAPAFKADMVGLTLSWDDGTTRRIESYVNNTTVVVDSDMPVALDIIAIENPDSYALYSDTSAMSRVQYRMAWSQLSEPRRYASVYYGTIAAGSNVMVLKYPVKSLEIGQEIVIAGAGLNGSNLTATAIYVAANRVVTLDQFASVAVTDAAVQASDASGGIAGWDDPEGDFSGVLRIKELSGAVVIYKDESITVGSFTGDSTYPFTWRNRKVPNGETLHYRYTLCQPGPDYHAYAGKNAFYRFDMTNQKPVVIPSGELCKDIFFDSAKIADKDTIWAADNTVTKEIWWVFPTSGSDKALCWDYLQDTWSTTSIAPTAGATIDRPIGGNEYGESEDWFVFTIGGVVLVYGRADEPVASWSPVVANPTVSAIFFRRTGATFAAASKTGYESRLQTGMDAFGTRHNEKHLRSFAIHLANGSTTSQMTWSLLGCRNIAENYATPLCTVTIAAPTTGNLVPLHYLQNYYGDILVVPAAVGGVQNLDKDVRITGKTYEVYGADSRSWTRNVPP